MAATVGETRQGSEILCPRIDSERETTNPKKFLKEGDSWKRRISSGEWILLTGRSNWYGGERTGTCSA